MNLYSGIKFLARWNTVLLMQRHLLIYYESISVCFDSEFAYLFVSEVNSMNALASYEFRCVIRVFYAEGSSNGDMPPKLITILSFIKCLLQI